MNLFSQKTNMIIKDYNILKDIFLPPLEHIHNREEELKTLAYSLVRDRRLNKNIILYGFPGSGKTMAVEFMLQEISKLTRFEPLLKIIRIKCQYHNTKHKVFKEISNQLTEDEKVNEDIYSQILSILKSNPKQLIVFLDEIHNLGKEDINDIIFILSRLNTDLYYHHTKDKTLNQEKVQSNVIFICASNDINLKKNFKPNTLSSLNATEITFNPYDIDTLYHILESRIMLGALEPSRIENEALLQICKLSYTSQGGDARRALSLLLNASEIAEMNKKEKLDLDSVQIAENSLKEDRIKKAVLNLGKLQRDVFWTIYSATKKEPNMITSGEIFLIFKRSTQKEKVSVARLSQIITELEFGGLIKTQQASSKRGNTRSISMNLELPLADDIMKSIEEETL